MTYAPEPSREHSACIDRFADDALARFLFRRSIVGRPLLLQRVTNQYQSLLGDQNGVLEVSFRMGHN